VNAALRGAPAPVCIVCGSAGRPRYSGLRDRLFGAPGEWRVVACPRASCGLLWLDPMPLVEDIALAYADYYTHAEGAFPRHALSRVFAKAKRAYLANAWGYGEGIGAGERLLGLLPYAYPGRRIDLDFSVMWLRPVAGGRLLDVGAGSGALVERMRGLGWRAEGLDFDSRSVSAARARGLVMHEGGLTPGRFAAASFDAVTMSHSIEHVHDPLAWLTEAKRILKPGGRLVLATPNAKSFLHRRFGQHWFALDPPRHLYLFNRAAMAELLRRAGFTDFRIFTSVRDAKAAWRGSRSIRDTGRYDMMARAPLPLRLAGQAMQLCEAVLNLADGDAGEDLVAQAVA
jgi:2-polyprenyl-3-methyl-5-hydroxy-6-metoxy-1,4-benzoquinol methylase